MKTQSLISWLIMFVVGLIFLIHPGGPVVAARILGIALLIIGILGAATEAAKKVDKSDKLLLVYIMEAVVGCILLIAPFFVASAFPFIIGLILVLLGASDVVRAILVLLGNVDGWKLAVGLAVVTIVLGIIVMINPFPSLLPLICMIGVILIYRAVTGFYVSQRMLWR